MSSSTAETLLRSTPLRVTVQRIAVLDVLGRNPHTDIRVLQSLVSQQIGSVSTQTMYDVLAALVRAGLVRRIGPAGSPALFELRGADNHHHVVCRVCGALHDVECGTGEVPCIAPSADHGFIVDEAEVTFWGTCPSCSKLGGADAPSATTANNEE
jgi:Fur family transcriptional regulator, stress-responsive regulator